MRTKRTNCWRGTYIDHSRRYLFLHIISSKRTAVAYILYEFFLHITEGFFTYYKKR